MSNNNDPNLNTLGANNTRINDGNRKKQNLTSGSAEEEKVRNAIRQYTLNRNHTITVTKSQLQKHYAPARKRLEENTTFFQQIIAKDQNILFRLDHKETQFHPIFSQFIRSNRQNVPKLRDYIHFPLYLKIENGNVLLWFNYGETDYRYRGTWIQWTYTPSSRSEIRPLINAVITEWIRLDVGAIQVKRNRDEDTIFMPLIKILERNIGYRVMINAMKSAKYPSRFWEINELRKIAENNVARYNIGSNYSGTKLERIESFLTRIDDLFESEASGVESHTDEEIIKIINGFARRTEMFALPAQKKVVNDLIEKKRNANATRPPVIPVVEGNVVSGKVLNS